MNIGINSKAGCRQDCMGAFNELRIETDPSASLSQRATPRHQTVTIMIHKSPAPFPAQFGSRQSRQQRCVFHGYPALIVKRLSAHACT
jgi:hypothetical protein